MSVTLDSKDPNVAAAYQIDFEDLLVGEAERDTAYATSAIVRPQRATGFYYECATAGRTAARYPLAWPVVSGETVSDGSLVWTCRHPSAVSAATVASVVWTMPSGLTKDSQSESGFVATVTVSGGTDGVDYEVLCRMTPSAGSVIEQTIIIPVRAQ